MILYISDDELRSLASIEESAQVIEDLFIQESVAQAENKPTVELTIPNGFFRLKAGVAYGYNCYGFKAYGGIRRAGRYLVFVYNLETAELEGIVEARGLTEIRTGAVSALATRYMARPDARTIGIIGTGREARAQVAALCKVRPIRSIKAYSRTAERREAFAQEMSEKLSIDVVPVRSAGECVRGADIVVTITSAKDPVLEGAWLDEGTYICAVGATTPNRRELDDEAVARAGTIVVEHLPQARAELGELLSAVEHGKLNWGKVRELKDIVGGQVPGRASPNEINLFDSIGVGTEDIAIASFALKKARELNLGQALPM